MTTSRSAERQKRTNHCRGAHEPCDSPLIFQQLRVDDVNMVITQSSQRLECALSPVSFVTVLIIL